MNINLPPSKGVVFIFLSSAMTGVAKLIENAPAVSSAERRAHVMAYSL